MVLGNSHRHSSSIILLAFAIAFLFVALLALSIRRERDKIEWVDYPTALGDPHFYGALGENDLHQPNLYVEGSAEALYRRSTTPLKIDEGKMLRVGHQTGGELTVYRPEGMEDSTVVYLKSGANSFHEFGEREHWPEYQPPSD